MASTHASLSQSVGPPPAHTPFGQHAALIRVLTEATSHAGAGASSSWARRRSSWHGTGTQCLEPGTLEPRTRWRRRDEATFERDDGR